MMVESPIPFRRKMTRLLIRRIQGETLLNAWKVRPAEVVWHSGRVYIQMVMKLTASAFFLTCISSASLVAQVQILTNHYDSSGTGANVQETILKPANVDGSKFGKLYNYPVDGSVYAQPLYVSAVNMPDGSKRNVLYVATMNDRVYAFDADRAGSPLWMRNLTESAADATPVPVADITGDNELNIVGNVGVLSTPVIELEGQTIYLVARTKESGAYVQRLYGLDIADGQG